jgi:xanthine dehydrogenase YagS FAD-binding subunit
VLFELPDFEHVDVKSIEETLQFLKNRERVKVLAGGTDLLGMMKDRITGPGLYLPKVLVNVKEVPEMKRLFRDEMGTVHIGGAVTLRELQRSSLIKPELGALGSALQQIGSLQIRARGTVAGNICQRLRCIYFRHPEFICFKKGGNRCYAPGGEHRYYHAIMHYGKCVAAHPSDLAPVFMAYDARATVNGLRGKRALSFRDLFSPENEGGETVLQSDELLTEIQVPDPGEKTVHRFLKSRIRQSVDFAMSSVVVVGRITQGVVENIRIVLGGIAPLPIEALESRDILRGKDLDDKAISDAAEAAVRGARPLPMNRYKVDLTKALVRRALEELRAR